MPLNFTVPLVPPSVTKLTLGELSTNCYIVSCPTTGEAVIIDPADTGEVIAEELTRSGLTPTAIWLTHGHFDHVLGLLPLVLAFDLPVYLHPDDLFLLRGAQKSAEHWLRHPVDPVPDQTVAIQPGENLTFGKYSFAVHHTPGHTPGSCSFHWQAAETETKHDRNEQFMYSTSPLLFVGDVIFEEGIGRTDFRYSDHEALERSIAALREKAHSALTYAGHGEEFLLQPTILEMRDLPDQLGF